MILSKTRKIGQQIKFHKNINTKLIQQL